MYLSKVQSGQILIENFDFRVHLSTFRAKDTPKSWHFNAEKNAKPKIPYFFISAEKFMAHSFIRNPEVLFFVEAGKKKNTNCFFFFYLEKFIRH